MTAPTPDRPDLNRDQFTNDESYYLATGRRVTLTLTPEQMRALAAQLESNADAHQEPRGTERRRAAAALRAAADQLEAVQAVLTRHPKCDKYDEDDVVSCGWKSAVRDITWAVSGKADAL